MTKHQTGTREEWLATMIRGMGDLRGPFWFRRHDEYDEG